MGAQRRLEIEKMRRFLRDNESIPIPIDWNIMKFVAQIDKRRRKQYGFIDPPGKNSGNSRRGRKTTSPRANPSYSKKRRNVSNKSKPKVTKKKKKKEETESEEEADLIESEHEENELQKEMEAELKKNEEAEEVEDEDAD